MFGIFGENVWQNTLASWRKRIRLFGENVFGDLEKTCLAILAIMRWHFGEIVQRFWRKRFGDNVGDLEKRGQRSYGDFVLEFAME